MNRLLLIGNGFDLAHGLATTYNDFIVWYLKYTFGRAYEEHQYADELIAIDRKDFFKDLDWRVFKDIDHYIEFYYQQGFSHLINNTDVFHKGTVYHPFFQVKLKSEFLSHLITTCLTSSWVDIENDFYTQLKQALGERDWRQKESKLLAINTSMKYIIQFLEQYLNTLPTPPALEGYQEIFESPILKDDIVTIQLREDAMPEETRALNFNYTSTVENYFAKARPLYSELDFEVNYIHGQIGDSKNPFIFGFGDELDEHYAKMDIENMRGFKEYIKTFWYLRTSNYHNLIRFIDAADFQVFILGHSCGLSDRTMLNMIFEHDHCKSIKIFYYQGKNGRNNFKELSHDISKHFNNKAIMRKKIVPLDKSFAMPQV